MAVKEKSDVMQGTLALMVLMPPDRISILTGLVQASTEAGARLQRQRVGGVRQVVRNQQRRNRLVQPRVE